MAEKGKVNCETKNNGYIDYDGFSYVGIQKTVPFSKMAEQMKKDFAKIIDAVIVQRNKGARHWICLYPKFDLKTLQVTYIAAISDEDVKNEDLGSEFVKGSIASGKMLEIQHDGSYDFIGNAWSMGMMCMQAEKKKTAGDPFEQYWNSPYDVSPEELKSSIYFPV